MRQRRLYPCNRPKKQRQNRWCNHNVASWPSLACCWCIRSQEQATHHQKRTREAELWSPGGRRSTTTACRLKQGNNSGGKTTRSMSINTTTSGWLCQQEGWLGAPELSSVTAVILQNSFLSSMHAQRILFRESQSKTVCNKNLCNQILAVRSIIKNPTSLPFVVSVATDSRSRCWWWC